jgi:hypothetical protein
LARKAETIFHYIESLLKLALLLNGDVYAKIDKRYLPSTCFIYGVFL